MGGMTMYLKIKLKQLIGNCCLILCLIFFVSCGAKQFVNYKPSINKQFEPSKQPAEITKLSADQLKAQGYLEIGAITAEQIIKECYDTWLGSRLADCSDHSFNEHPTAALLKDAAEKGGHLVLLTMNNEVINRDATKNTGICERDRTETRTVNRPVSTLKGYKDNYVQERTTICEQYKHVKGVQTIERSSGSVWRKEN
jgi:hypothetical protein